MKPWVGAASPGPTSASATAPSPRSPISSIETGLALPPQNAQKGEVAGLRRIAFRSVIAAVSAMQDHIALQKISRRQIVLKIKLPPERDQLFEIEHRPGIRAVKDKIRLLENRRYDSSCA